MRGLFLLLLLIPLRMVGQPGPYWAFGYGSLGDDRVTAIARGPGATIYACGTFSGTMLGPAGPVQSVGITDVFVVRMDTVGNVAWIRTAGGLGPERCTDLAVDGDGGVVITGQYSVGMTLPGATLAANVGSQDVFTARFASDGTLLWARSGGSSGSTDIGQQVSINGAGEVFVAGEFSATAQFGSLQATSTADPELSGAPGDDVFVVKYDASGTEQWLRTAAAPNADKALGLAAGEDGACYVTGLFHQDITFDVLHPNTLNNAAFVVKLGTTGDEQWFRRIGGGGGVLAGDLCLVGDTLWLVGSQSGNNLVFGLPVVPIASTYPYSAFVLGFSAAGELLAQVSSGSDHVIEGKCLDVHDGRIAAGGTFFCQADQLSASQGGDGLFIAWGPPNGWVAIWNRADLQLTYAQMLASQETMDLRGVAFDMRNNLYAVGEYSSGLVIPDMEGAMRVLPGDSLITVGPGGILTGCNDTTYYDAGRLRSRGVLDGFITRGFIPARAPLDIFDRTVCDKDYAATLSVQPLSPPSCEVPGFDASFCGEGGLVAVLNFYPGPLANVLWNGTVQGSTYPVNAEGTYTAVADIGPGCFQLEAATSAGICPPAEVSGISDSEGVNVESTQPLPVITCLPELVTLTAGPINGTSFQWVHEPDTAFSQVAFVAWQDGVWQLRTTNEVGCIATTQISLNYVDSEPLGSVTANMALEFQGDADGNDTLNICSHQTIDVRMLADVFMDGSELGNGSAYNVVDTLFAGLGIIDQGPFDLGQGYEDAFTTYVGDGWYVFTFRLSVNNRPCLAQQASFVVRDSIYVSGQPSTIGAVDIMGSIFICDGQQITLTAEANAPGTFSWNATDGGIVGSEEGPSVVVDQACGVTVIFMPSDTGSCIAGDVDEHAVQYVPPPMISMSPADGLVCPGSPVQLTVTGVAGGYTWYGPNGQLPFTTPSITVTDGGQYFCVVSTVEGCEYATALRTVVLLGTPYVDIQPQPVLCAGSSVFVQAQPSQNAQYVWSAPLTGTGSGQNITAPGTYTCSVTSCGSTTVVPFTITQSTVSVDILDDGPFEFCPGDSVQLEATAGALAYLWLPEGDVSQQVQVHEEGAHYVLAFDQYGCRDSAGVATVIIHDFAQQLMVSIDTVCSGEVSIGHGTGSGVIEWFADAALQTLLATGPSVLFGPFAGTSEVYVTQTDAFCQSYAIAAEAFVIPSGMSLTITGDTTLCEGGILSLSASPGAVFNWTTPLGPFSGAEVIIPQVTTAAAGLWSVSASQSDCTVGGGSIQVSVSDPQAVVQDPGPFVLCPGDTIQLTAEPGAISYTWLPGGENGLAIEVLEPGTWSVLIVDDIGCSDTSLTVVVDPFIFSQPLTVAPPTVCSGTTVTLIASGSGTINWYADAALDTLLNVGGQLIIPQIQDSLPLYLTQTEGDCTSPPWATLVPVMITPPAPEVEGDTVLCFGENLLLSIPFVYAPTWSTPFGAMSGWLAAWSGITQAQQGEYSVFLTNGPCVGDTSVVTVDVVMPPLISAGQDQEICLGDLAELSVFGGVEWLWSTGQITNTIEVGDAGAYWVIATIPPGCSAADTVSVQFGDCEVSVPNIITPNDDGTHDEITVTSPSAEPLTWSIYNRWGQLVFKRTARNVSWDGRTSFGGEPLSEGVYFYVLNSVLPNGEVYEKGGYIHLAR